MEIETVADEDELYHRVPGFCILETGRVSSGAFKTPKKKPKPCPFSVDVARLTTAEETRSRDIPGLGVIGFFAGSARDVEFEVSHDPREHNYAHGAVDGTNDIDKCSRLADASHPVLRPRPRPE